MGNPKDAEKREEKESVTLQSPSSSLIQSVFFFWRSS